MCKVEIKDSYFSVPLRKSSRNYVRLSWSGNFFKFLSLCFGWVQLQECLEILMSILMRINIRIEILIFLMQYLGFVLNLEKSILNPVQEIELVGVTINSLKMYLSLAQDEVLRI